MDPVNGASGRPIQNPSPAATNACPECGQLRQRIQALEAELKQAQEDRDNYRYFFAHWSRSQVTEEDIKRWENTDWENGWIPAEQIEAELDEWLKESEEA